MGELKSACTVGEILIQKCFMTWACKFLLKWPSRAKKKMLGEEWKKEENTASQMQLSGANSHKCGTRCEDEISTRSYVPGLTDIRNKCKSSSTA